MELNHVAGSGLETDIVLGFTLYASSTLSEEQIDSEIKVLERRLKSHPKLAKAFEYLRLFLAIGTSIAEVRGIRV